MTKVVIDGDCIEIRLAQSHLAGALFGFVLAVGLVYSFRGNTWIIAMLIGMIYVVMQTQLALKKRFPIRIVPRHRHEEMPDSNRGQTFFVDEVAGIVVRENINRDSVDDHRMVQLYLLFDRGPILIHQHHYSKAARARMLSLGGQIERWLESEHK